MNTAIPCATTAKDHDNLWRSHYITFRSDPLSTNATAERILAEAEKVGGTIVRTVIFAHGCWVSAPALRRHFPCAVVGNQFDFGTTGMEVEIFLIIPHDSSVTINPVTSSTGEFIGQHLTSPQERGLWITGAGDPASTFSAEVAQCYTETSRLLREYELSTSDIIRTWYFISDIKHNYRPFNVARDHAFKQWNIIHYPASTAIGADFRGERNLFGMFDAYGSLRSSKSLQLLSAASQCDPASYAIKFSRAATVDIGTRRTVYVSGTSCIGPTGQSMTSDPTLNTKAMLDTVLELLAQGATNTDDIVSCYAYFTNDTYEKEWIALLQRQGIALNYISHRASVCRPDLPIEIELRAELSLSGSR